MCLTYWPVASYIYFYFLFVNDLFTYFFKSRQNCSHTIMKELLCTSSIIFSTISNLALDWTLFLPPSSILLAHLLLPIISRPPCIAPVGWLLHVTRQAVALNVNSVCCAVCIYAPCTLSHCSAPRGWSYWSTARLASWIKTQASTSFKHMRASIPAPRSGRLADFSGCYWRRWDTVVQEADESEWSVFRLSSEEKNTIILLERWKPMLQRGT